MTTTAEQNKELVRKLYKAVQDADIDTFFGSCSPDMVLYEASSMEVGGTHRGHEEIGVVLGKLAALYDLSTITIERLVADGEFVVGLASFRTPGGYETRVSEWWHIVDGMVVEVRPFYWDTEELNQVIAGAT